MFILQVIWFYALLLFVPLGIGQLFYPEKRLYSPAVYIMGLFTAFAVYEIIGLVCALVFKTSLTLLTVLWSIAMAVLCGLGWWNARKKRSGLVLERLQLSHTACVLLIFICLIIAVEAFRAVTGFTDAWDDSDYMAQATTSLYTNTINQYEPQTGNAGELLNFSEPHHKVALWSILWASMTQLTGIHPAILMRTLLPVIIFPCAYGAVYLVLKELFNGDMEKSLIGVFFLQVSYEIISAGGGMKQWWLILYSWYGKSVTANLISPILLFLFLCLWRETDRKKQRPLWVMTAITAWAGCLVAASAFLMVPFMLGVLGLAYLLLKRDLIFCVKLGCCALPCLFLYVLTK